MKTEIIKKRLNKVYEDMGGGMVSSAAGITGIEFMQPVKKKILTDHEKDIDKKVKNMPK